MTTANRKLFLLLLLATSLLILASGGTLAYATREAGATTTLTTGRVEISITDVPEHLRGNRTNLEPGVTFYTNPVIENTGEKDCYVRIQISIDPANVTMDELSMRLWRSQGGNGDWEDMWIQGEDGWFYYKNMLKPSDSISVFETMRNENGPYTAYLPGTWGNEYQQIQLSVSVSPEAIQADNLSVSFEPDAWPFWRGV